MLPLGSDGVVEYRYRRAAKQMGDFHELRMHDIYGGKADESEASRFLNHAGSEVPKAKVAAIARWFEREGLDWDLLWTSNYAPDAQAIQQVIRSLDRPVVFELDDWFEGVPTGNAAIRHWWGQKRAWLKECLEAADRVVASTPMLADKYGGLVAPNFVDPGEWDWPHRSSKRTDECVILCNGGMGRDGDYLAKEGALRAALELPHVKVVFMNSFPEWALEYPAGKVVWVSFVPYEQYNRMVRWIAPDILMSPLEHNDFNLAKSNLKWLEAAMAGACFVGERWGEYERTVVDGVSGVLACGDEEWAGVLRELALDPDRRAAIAAEGRRVVESQWTWKAVEPMWRAAVLGEADNGSGGQR